MDATVVYVSAGGKNTSTRLDVHTREREARVVVVKCEWMLVFVCVYFGNYGAPTTY
jgi:hypothetical protein